MELKDLVGIHTLSAVDKDIESIDNYHVKEANVIYFKLDDIIYKASEDPSDGYRSYLNDLEICDDYKIKNKFEPQKVICEMVPDDEGYFTQKNNILDIKNYHTNKIILSIGTHHYDDWYPSCVTDYRPENLSINSVLSDVNEDKMKVIVSNYIAFNFDTNCNELRYIIKKFLSQNLDYAKKVKEILDAKNKKYD